jgi:uncharacterized membrane protein YdjX (TVP38/TMEM64 family)
MSALEPREPGLAAAASPVSRGPSAVAWAKMALLLAFAAGAIAIYRTTPVGQYLTKEAVRGFVNSFGALAPLVHISLYAITVTCFVPATVMTIAGAVVFGKVMGAMYNILGASLGASLAFFVGHHLGRDLASRLVRGKLLELDAAAERNGFRLIYYLRMVYFPFVPLNYAAALTRIRFRDFFWGTFLGIIPGTFIYTYFVDEVTNLSGVGDLVRPRFLIPLGLFVASFFIPKAIKMIAGDRFGPGVNHKP